jgi:hypothetical protein
MALSKEDHTDIKNALGKAMANKISKVTQDKSRMKPRKWFTEGKKVDANRPTAPASSMRRHYLE